MTRIVVLGGTGYAGAHIVAEAAARGLDVTSWSRTLPETPVAGVTYETGSLLDAPTLARAVQGADVVVAALSPRGELDGKLRELYLDAAKVAAEAGARWIAVGGFGSLRLAPGADRIAHGADFPAEYAPEARVGASVADDLLEKAPADLDWLFVSPAAEFGSYAPGEKVGSYRVTGDVALFDAEGKSAISGHDFATAIVDEIVNPTRRRAHVGFAY